MPGFGGIVLTIKENGKTICAPILFYSDDELKALRDEINDYYGD